MSIQMSKTQHNLMLRALAVFMLTAGLAVVVNSQKYGFRPNYSISRYVGLETWSAVLFAFGNIFVAGWMAKYLFQIGRSWQVRHWYFWVVVVMVVTLIGLSVCPLGYFSRLGLALPDRIHEICSRTMFAAMLLIAGVALVQKEMRFPVRVAAGVFMLYGLMCAFGYFGHVTWFRGNLLYFETSYLVGFMLVSWSFQNRLPKLKKGAKNGTT